ncbi:MAG: 50S ribosomal protein L21 [Candidatus Sericytochromatia bacterium]
MYAIIESGGKQYKAEQGRWLDLELLYAEEGSTVQFPVLMVVDGDKTTTGQPRLESAAVTGKVLREEVKGKKLISFKFRAKKGYQRKVGHRQKYTRVMIEEISLG